MSNRGETPSEGTPVSQPNDPDTKSPATPASGGAPEGPGAQAGPQRGGLVPPWQRGPADVTPQPTPPPGEGDKNGNGERPAGPPPRGVVSSGPAAGPGGGGPAGTGGPGGGAPTNGQVPVKKLDAPQVGPSVPAPTGKPDAKEPPRPRFTEVPTRTITRDPSADEQLPDLDQIHHADVAKAAAAASNAKTETITRPAPTQVGKTAAGGAGLRAAVQIRRLDPWATFKVCGTLAVIGFVIWMIAVAVLYLVLDGMGVWEQVNSSFGTLVTADSTSTEGDIIGAGSVFGYAALLGVINSILVTALATIGAYIYNIVADMVGGLEVTLADLD
nr:hypothetical protein ISGA_3607 [Gordonia sp. NB41Y]